MHGLTTLYNLYIRGHLLRASGKISDFRTTPGSAGVARVVVTRYATAQYKQDFLRFVWTFNFISSQIREIRGLTVDCSCTSDTNGDGNWRPFKRRVQYLFFQLSNTFTSQITEMLLRTF